MSSAAPAAAGPSHIAAWTSSAYSHVARNWLIWTCSPVAAMAIALVGWIVFRPSPVEKVARVADGAQPAVVASIDGAAAPVDTDVDPRPEPRDSGSGLASAVVAGAAAEIAPASLGEDAAADEASDEPTAIVTDADEPRDGEMPDEIADASDPPDASAEDAPPAAAAPVAPRLRSPVDVQARLADPLPSVNFQRVALADFCDLIAQMTGVPITLDIDALAAAGIRASDPLSVRMNDTTVGDALAAALAERQLVYVVLGQHIVVGLSALRSAELAVAKYDIRDLAGTSADEAAHLINVVTRFVDPKSWQDRGGSGGIKIADGQLIVEQTPLAERQIATLLDALRAARGIATGGAAPRNAAPLATRYAGAKAMLDKHVTANFSLPAPLADILAWLGRSTGTSFLIDVGSLEHAGLSRDLPATFVVNDQPLEEALGALLEPLGCAFRIVDGRTFQVYARQAGGAAEPQELELYAVGDLLVRGVDGARIITFLRDKVDPKCWADAGGAGDIEFDARGKCLIVRQSPGAQMALAKVLAGVREKSAKRRE